MSRIDTSFRLGMRLWFLGWRMQKEWRIFRKKLTTWWYG